MRDKEKDKEKEKERERERKSVAIIFLNCLGQNEKIRKLYLNERNSM
jgi:hypothetical protein